MSSLRARPDFDKLHMPALLNALIADGAVIEVSYVHGHWRGVNDVEDFRQAVDSAHAQAPFRHRCGFQWYAGVPCSCLTPFINYVLPDSSLRYVSVANQGDAVALIAGVALAGSRAPTSAGCGTVRHFGSAAGAS